jgi:hypothetical protein
MRLALQAAVVVAAAALPYLNTLNAGFTYDDKVAVMSNADVINHGIPLADLFVHDFWGNAMRISLPEWLGGNSSATESHWTHNSYRPLTVLTFRFNHWLHDLREFGFHAANVAMHVACGLCAWFLFRRIVGPQRWPQAFAAAILFCVHPIHTGAAV